MLKQITPVDALEPRQLLAFSTFFPGSGQVSVMGTGGDDQITVTLQESVGLLAITLNGQTETHSRAAVQLVQILAMAGDDDVRILAKVKTTVRAGDGNDFVLGGRAGETFYGGPGRDTLDGGSGNDMLIEGNDGAIRTENDDDQLYGRAGTDHLRTGGGIDILDGGSGTADLVDFDAFNVDLRLSLDGLTNDGPVGSAGSTILNTENLRGGEGADSIVGNGAANRLEGGGSDGTDTILGLGGDDSLVATAIGSILDGGSGDDQIVARNATARGQAGDDDITLRTGDGSGPPDEPNGGLADGGSGNDTLRGIGPAFTLRGNAGDDLILYSAQSQAFAGGVTPGITPLTADIGGGGGRDTLELLLLIVSGGNEGGYGIDFDDIANDGVQEMQGQMNFRSDFEVVRGSPGKDTIDAGSLQRGIHINGGFNNDTIIGGNGADLLEGEDGSDSIDGGAGDDVLRGGAGGDSLGGDRGRDSFNGGKGNDVFNAVDGEADTINGAQGLDDIAEFDNALDTLIRVEREI